MLVEERRSKILEIVRDKGFASLDELCRTLQVSESTIRRDLEILEDLGNARRTHGGVFYAGSSPRMPPFEERQPAQWDKKLAIARRTAQLIEEDDTILLDGGSTTYAVAQLLLGRRLQIVTNSLPVANLFSADSQVHLVLIGGYLYPRTGVALGPYADAILQKLSVRRSFMSVGGITERGFYNSNLLLVETERAMMDAASEVIVVADSTKFGRQSLSHLCELSAVDRLVVDDGIDAAWKKKVSDAGVELLVAETGGQGGKETSP